MEEQRDLIHCWEQNHCERAQVAALKAELFLTQEKLNKAMYDIDVQSTRITELELSLKNMESKRVESSTAPQLKENSTQLTSTALQSADDLIHEFEQNQSFIAQYLRQKTSIVDPYADCDRDKGGHCCHHHHERNEPFIVCNGECSVFIEQLTRELECCRKDVHCHLQLAIQQQEHHSVTLKVVNDKYRDLKTAYQLLQQRVTSLVYQLQLMSRSRPVMLGSPPDTQMSYSHHVPPEQAVYISAVQPQHNFE
jgi:chromosome segregation ATPase